MGLRFEWNPAKAIQNRRKHRVSSEEAATVFGDTLSITVPAPDHSATEDRFVTVGMSARDRLLLVAHTERRRHIRIISARELTRKERWDYEQRDYCDTG